MQTPSLFAAFGGCGRTLFGRGRIGLRVVSIERQHINRRQIANRVGQSVGLGRRLVVRDRAHRIAGDLIGTGSKPKPLVQRRRQPQHLPQRVVDGTANPIVGKRLKGHTLGGVVALGRLDQPDVARGDQFLQIHLGGKRAGDLLGQRPYVVAMLLDELSRRGVHGCHPVREPSPRSKPSKLESSVWGMMRAGLRWG